MILDFNNLENEPMERLVEARKALDDCIAQRKEFASIEYARMHKHRWQYQYTGHHGSDKEDDYYRCADPKCIAHIQDTGSSAYLYYNCKLISILPKSEYAEQI